MKTIISEPDFVVYEVFLTVEGIPWQAEKGTAHTQCISRVTSSSKVLAAWAAEERWQGQWSWLPVVPPRWHSPMHWLPPWLHGDCPLPCVG